MERNYAIDFIKFFAIIAVVIIHTFPSDSEPKYFILDNLSRFAVPYFFTASGYLFGLKILNTPNTFAYFKRYEIKILKIYFSWILFYFLYDVFRIFMRDGRQGQELTEYLDQLSPLKLFYYGQGTSGYQLWFVIALAWSIAILYIFVKFNKLLWLLIISLGLHLIGLFGQSYSIFFEFPLTTRDALFIGLFYTTLGCWFANPPTMQSRLVSKNTTFYLVCFFIAIQISEGFLLEKVLNAKHGEYFLSTIFLTAFLFLFTVKNPLLGKGHIITKIGGTALSIYAIHVLFIDIVDIVLNAVNLGQVSHNIIWNIVDAFLVFNMSYISYNYLQYIKAQLPIGTKN